MQTVPPNQPRYPRVDCALHQKEALKDADSLFGRNVDSHVAWRVRHDSPIRYRPRVTFRRLQRMAEMTCFKALGWQFPVHIFDQHTAYLAASNILLPYNPDEVRKKPRKRLSDACCAYGLDGWERIDKEDISKVVGDGHWREYGRERVFDYCEEDVRMS